MILVNAIGRMPKWNELPPDDSLNYKGPRHLGGQGEGFRRLFLRPRCAGPRTATMRSDGGFTALPLLLRWPAVPFL